MSVDLNCCGNPEGPTLDGNYWNSQYVANTTGWDLIENANIWLEELKNKKGDDSESPL